MFDLNVFSLINLNRIAVRHFYDSGNVGSLAITSSIAGLIGAPNCASYTGAKHALHVRLLFFKHSKESHHGEYCAI